MKKTKSIEKAFSPKRAAFTMADPLRGGTHFRWLRRKAVAFTMAEILLSLAVIGIIAAMTLPTLTANFQDRAFNAKRQALHARLANAFRTMDYTDYLPIIWDNSNGNVEKFMNDLTKVLSIKVINDPEIIFGRMNTDGDTNNWYNPLGQASAYPYAGYPNAYFQTVNGESIGILLNNPEKSDKNYPGSSFCFLIVYDLNGTKGPNKWGKDMGVMGAFYYENMELYAPMPGAITDNPINTDCDWENDSSCQKYKYPDLRLATREELITLMGYNNTNFVPFYYENKTLCSIDGNMYAPGSPLYGWDEGSSSNEEEGEESCTYLLITNDGSAPKNGVTIDVSTEDSGE